MPDSKICSGRDFAYKEFSSNIHIVLTENPNLLYAHLPSNTIFSL